MQKKSIVGICLIGALIISFLPFVGVAKQAKRQANGVIIEEPNTKKKVEVVEHIASCGFTRPIRVASTSNNRPFGWSERVRSSISNGLESKGFGIDMFEEIAKKLKLKYQIVGYARDEDAIKDLKKGNLDLLIGIYTPSTTIGKNTTPIYPAMFSNVFTVYYPKDHEFEVRDYESLHNKAGVLRRTENVYPLFHSHITPDMSITLETTENAFKKLLIGSADYLIGSPYSIEAELRRYKLHDEIVSSSKVLFDAAMFMVLTRATDCFKLRDMLGKEIANYNSDSNRVDKQLRKVIDDWGERFRENAKLEIKDAEIITHSTDSVQDMSNVEAIEDSSNAEDEVSTAEVSATAINAEINSKKN